VKSYSLDAFVLRLRPLGEADRILTLFSRERGKSSAVAKGVRKTASKFGARLDFFTRSRLTLHEGRSLDVITGAALVSGGWERLVQPDVYAFASYVAELLDGLSEPDLAVPEVFELLEELQSALFEKRADALPEKESTSALRPVFDLRLMGALGFGLELDACVRCGSELGRRPFAGGRAMLSPEAGGLVCRACLDAGADGADEVRRDLGVVRLSAHEFEMLRDARALPFGDAMEMPELAPLSRATQAFVQHHLGRTSRALSSADRDAGRRPGSRRGGTTAARPSLAGPRP
jgi:DNA repair protein RecO (recombination protein O)